MKFEQQMQQMREARETGGKRQKATSSHTFGLKDSLFTPEYQQNRNLKNYNQMLKHIDEDISQTEA